jgi:molybdenum cofactor cytidylyltransferase
VTARAAAVILAAGLSTRFGSDKLRAMLAGKPLLQHVIDAAIAVPLAPVVVVVSEVDQGLERRGVRCVRNPDPSRGVSSSLRIGLDELRPDAPIERAVVLLGDQPRVSGAVIELLLARGGCPIRVPRYADGTPGNPVVLDRSVWALATGLTGDRGMSQLFANRPDLVAYVDVPGHNPDVDTREDLAALELSQP